MASTRRWVLLAYRLPREPSTPRIAIWRDLRRLGATQIADGVVALPLDARTHERLEWLAEEITDHDGEATIWLAEPANAAQERDLRERMTAAIVTEYAELATQAKEAAMEPAGVRRRTLGRLRRELRRIRSRDYFAPPIAARATSAVEDVSRSLEAVS